MYPEKLEKVYAVWNGKLCSYNVYSYNPATGQFGAIDQSRSFTSTLGGDIFFATAEEAIKQEYNDLQEMHLGCMEEYLDALATYRAIRKQAKVTLEEFTAKMLA